MEKVSVGFVGVGGIGSVHLKNVMQMENAEITALCDVNAEHVREKAKECGISAYYSDVDELLNHESIDALFVCVPPFAHGDIEEKAAEKGIHLLVEKPVALDLKTALMKSRVIEAAGIINASGYCLRYIDVLHKAKEYLQGKQIAMVRGHYLSSFVPTPWFRRMEKSGGQLTEQATHILDLMRYLAGDIERVYADMSLNVLQDIENMNIPDVTSVNCRFQSGAIGHLDCTLTQPDFRTGIEVLGRDFRVEVTFSSVTIVEKDNRMEYNSEKDFYKEQDASFLHAVQTGDPTGIRATYSDGVRTLAATLAANQSAQTGEAVSPSDEGGY